ncbi:hypothetical protein NCCP2222_04390 [Sporosarcina sp. NCCP-2222]|uniref:hypothetical protein n=1 Tax=Sporosarcina sp. NCCP-2222 TaxID=2935073 RepID=UPI00208C7BE3|nr:hypothetical protein [Sporosarcina sp. NCCP-2222]GKV54492.1 hypothetical protein NCCP2222_04390 [Sporosarcina sp. NCCP-2222]
MIKSKPGVLILSSVIVLAIIFWYMQKEPYSTTRVVNSLSEKFEIQSTQIGITDPVISIDVYDKNDIPEVEKYLKENLFKDDLRHYEIEIFSRWS